MGYRPTNFILQELVPPDIFAARGERAWELLDIYSLVTLQALRDRFGRIVVNNWHAGGSFKESGLRSLTTKTGAALSQHRFGRAKDCKSETVTPREMCEYVIKHPDEFPYLTTIENPDATPGWFHYDTRNHGRKGVWIVNP